MTTLIFCAGAEHPDLSAVADFPSALLVGVDAGAARLAVAGFTPDWAVGDFDSAPPPACCRHIVRLAAEKDDTDLEAALLHILPRYAVDEIKQILIIGALGAGRLDHLLANIWLAHQPRFAAWTDKIRFIERHNTAAFYRAGHHTLRRETDKRYLSFIGLTALRQLSLHGVRYPLHGADYAHPCALISNEFLHDQMTFSFTDGLLCVIQSRDGIES